MNPKRLCRVHLFFFFELREQPPKKIHIESIQYSLQYFTSINSTNHSLIMSSSLGAPYNEYASLYDVGSSPVESSPFTAYTTVFTVLLLLLAFGSLSMALLGDVKQKSAVSYTLNAIVASISIGLSAIYVSNYVGVYI